MDPTQVVGTFAPGTYAPFGQPAPTGYPPAGPSSGYGGGFPQPTPVQQQFLGNVVSENIRSYPKYQVIIITKNYELLKNFNEILSLI